METKVRFAVVGLGHIAQVAVLPAFAHAGECELAALVSSDRGKLAELSKIYDIEHTGTYDELERVLTEADVHVAYIALPNSLHRAFTERCARAGVHVLCEKPMASTEQDCEAMIHVCDENDVKLMIAYRLHFEPANLGAFEIARSGRLGELRYFSSTFGQTVSEGDIRTRPELGGGALLDLGIYCINAARNLFREEPQSVYAVQSLVRGVDETTAAILRFSGDRFAQITASQAAADVDAYRIGGTKGVLRLEPAYTYFGELTQHLTIGEETTTRTFPKSDQFAPELSYFADCIVNDMDPEPSGEEGLADVRVIEAIIQSARAGAGVSLAPFARARRPGLELAKVMPPVERPKTVQTAFQGR